MTIIVNYLWMNQNPHVPQAIPSNSFFNLQQNAARYPDALFNLWIEDHQAYKAYAIPPNVKIHELRSIPALTNFPLLSSDKAEHIWAKVDMARLLVLQHTLLSDCTVSLYADFDIEDISLSSKGFQERMNTYGVVVGASFNPVERNIMHRRAENGYMAFAPDTANLVDFVIEKISDIFKVMTPNALDDRNTIYFATMLMLTKWAKNNEHPKNKPFPLSWQDDVASFPIQYPSQFKPAEQILPAEIKASEPQVKNTSPHVPLLTP